VELSVPDPCLLLLVGPSGSGKTTFAARRFAPGEVVSSDAYRRLVGGDKSAMGANEEAFALLHRDVATRLAARRFTLVDATNVQRVSRAMLLDLARVAAVPSAAIVFDLPSGVLHERHAARTDRSFGHGVIGRQRADLRRSLPGLPEEGFTAVVVLRTIEEVEGVVIRRVPARIEPG
jgi:protein phosphatase